MWFGYDFKYSFKCVNSVFDSGKGYWVLFKIMFNNNKIFDIFNFISNTQANTFISAQNLWMNFEKKKSSPH